MMIITDREKLRVKCEDASLFEAQGIISQLEEELKKSKIGIGLAAPQIGLNKCVAIIRIGEIKVDLVNPIIIEQYDRSLFCQEGCLSFPNEFLTTARYNEIFVQDSLHSAGLVCTGLEAVVVQHEIGHLNGELMYDFIVEIPAGRNSPCWCESEKKYKKCCLGKEIK